MKDGQKGYVHPTDFLEDKKPYLSEEFGYDEQFNDLQEDEEVVNYNQCLQLN